jgi:hypothetical protein
MIGMKETGEFPILNGVSGNLTTSSVSGPYLNPFGDVLALKGVIARLGTAGGTQATIVDILKNGTTIFASGKINFATSSTTPTYGPLTTNPTTFAKGDELKVTVTQVGSGAAPADLAFGLLFCKPAGTKYPAAMITDGF